MINDLFEAFWTVGSMFEGQWFSAEADSHEVARMVIPCYFEDRSPVQAAVREGKRLGTMA